MVKKKVSSKKKVVDKEKGIDDFVDEIMEVEEWIIERKNFLIKLAWVIGFITVLLIVSNFFLKVGGFG